MKNIIYLILAVVALGSCTHKDANLDIKPSSIAIAKKPALWKMRGVPEYMTYSNDSMAKLFYSYPGAPSGHLPQVQIWKVNGDTVWVPAYQQYWVLHQYANGDSLLVNTSYMGSKLHWNVPMKFSRWN